MTTRARRGSSNLDWFLDRSQALLADIPKNPIRPVPRVARQQRQRRLTAGQQAELLERYLSGERSFQLATAFGVSRHTVEKLLVDSGARRPRSMTPEEIAEAIDLYAQGWSCALIGDHLGRNDGTVWHALRRAGIPLRLPSGKPRHPGQVPT